MTFSVIIPVFNTPPDILFEAVYSVMRQDYSEPFRLVLINDRSTNHETLEALELLSKTVELINLPKNVGLSGVMNHALSICKTEYLVRMDSDDISAPNRLSKQVEYLKNNLETDILGCNLFAFNSGDIDRKPLFITKHKEEPTIDEARGDDCFWIVNHATVIMRVQAVLDCGGYDESFRRKQDVNLWRRMFEAGKVFRNITDILYAWRRYDEDLQASAPSASS